MNLETSAGADPMAKVGLNNFLIREIKQHGIEVSFLGSGNNAHVDIDTSNVYLGNVDSEGKVFSSKLSSLQIEGSKITQIDRSSDGRVTFHVRREEDGREKVYCFSKTKWEEASESAQNFLIRQIKE